MANATLTLTTKDFGLEQGSPAHKYFTERVWARCGRYTPGGASGQIHNSARLSVDEISYTHPGAHYMWYGEVMGPNIPMQTEDGLIFRSPKGKPKYYTGRSLKYTNPNTGSHWEEKMWASESDKIVDEVENYIERRYL